MNEAKSNVTPTRTTTKLDRDEPSSPVNDTRYRGMIGPLLCLTASRPNIVFNIGLCARFQSCPKVSNVKVTKRMLRYLKVTINVVLLYPTGDLFDLKGFADTDYAGMVDRKSTSSMAHFIGPCLISWASRKENFVSLSTAKAEYVATASCCSQLLWIKQQLKDFRIKIGCTPILCDDTSAMNMYKNPVQHKRTKLIDIRHHFLLDNVEKGNIVMTFCKIEDQVADIFTKAIGRESF